MKQRVATREISSVVFGFEHPSRVKKSLEEYHEKGSGRCTLVPDPVRLHCRGKRSEAKDGTIAKNDRPAASHESCECPETEAWHGLARPG
jgi:hypothetical protein